MGYDRDRDREDDEPPPRHRTQDFLIMFNLVTLLLGIIVFAYALWVKNNFTDGWSTVVSLQAVWVAIFGGLLMCMISCLGCYAAKKNKKSYLCWYLVAVIILLAFQIAMTVVMFNYAGAFQALGKGTSSSLKNLAGRDAVDLNNAILSSFIQCCTGCPTGCTNPNTNAFSRTTHPYCVDAAPACKVPVACDPNSVYEDNCFVYKAGDALIVPTHYIDITFCTMLSSLQQGGYYIAGPAKTGSCGGGDPAVYTSYISAYVGPKLYFVGVAFAVITAVQSTVLFVGCYVLFCVSRPVSEDDD